MADRKMLAELDLPPFAHVSEEDAGDPNKVRRYLYHTADVTLPGDIQLELHPYYGEPNTPCGWSVTVYEQPNLPEETSA